MGIFTALQYFRNVVNSSTFIIQDTCTASCFVLECIYEYRSLSNHWFSVLIFGLNSVFLYEGWFLVLERILKHSRNLVFSSKAWTLFSGWFFVQNCFPMERLFSTQNFVFNNDIKTGSVPTLVLCSDAGSRS